MSVYQSYDSNVRKTWVLMTLFFLVVIAIGFTFAQVWQDSTILYVAIAFSLFMNFFSYWYSDRIVLSISGAIPADKKEFWDLYTVTENLAITAGIPMPKLYVIPDAAPNAFATGRDKEHAAVAVTRGLLEILNKTELEGVVAHELSHIKNRDILLSTVVVVLVGFISIMADIFLRGMLWGGRSRDDEGRGLLVLVGVLLAILSPIAVTLIQLAISRKREFLADASGALLTRYPDGLASALKKISSYPGQMKRVSQATAHLYISNPFRGKQVARLFMTHPPVEERIAALMGQKEEAVV